LFGLLTVGQSLTWLLLAPGITATSLRLNANAGF
jgi:hypothetical protein